MAHHALGALAFRVAQGGRVGLPQPHWLGHAQASSVYHWSQQRAMPGYGVCHFTLAGAGRLECGRGRSLLVPPGRALLYEPGEAACPYRGPPSATAPWEFLAFFFTGTAALTLFWDLVANHGRILPVPADALWYDRLRSLGCHQRGECRLGPAEGAELVLACLIGLMREAEAQGVATPARDLAVAAETWIAGHLHEGIGVADVAAALGVSREHLARTVKAVRGTTVGGLLDRLRVATAAQRLRAGPETVAAIAAAVGLEVGTLHRTFRRVTGLTPARYRRRRGAP